MADTKLTALANAGALSGTDVVYLVQGTTSYKTTLDEIKSLVLNGYDLDALGDVDVSTVAPTDGEFLRFNGTNWVPFTSFTQHEFTLNAVSQDFAIPAGARRLTFIGEDISPAAGGVFNVAGVAGGVQTDFDASRSAISNSLAALDSDNSSTMHAEGFSNGDSINIEGILLSPRDTSVKTIYKGVIMFNGSDKQTHGFAKQSVAGDIDALRVYTSGAVLTGTVHIMVDY